MLRDIYIYPTFAYERLDRITADDVTRWYDALAPGKETIWAQAYDHGAALIAVASAPPKRLAGGDYWEAMKGDMTGWFELRVATLKFESAAMLQLVEYGR